MGMYVWLGIAAVMALIEAFSLTLVTIWFVIGGLVAFAAAYFGAPLYVQVILFLAVSAVSLALLRPLIMKHRALGEKTESTPVGLTARVVEDIDPATGAGRVETPDRMSWAAVSLDGMPIEKGANVKVVGNESIKLVVERM